MIVILLDEKEKLALPTFIFKMDLPVAVCHGWPVVRNLATLTSVQSHFL
jgi:hypothetical protein